MRIGLRESLRQLLPFGGKPTHLVVEGRAQLHDLVAAALDFSRYGGRAGLRRIAFAFEPGDFRTNFPSGRRMTQASANNEAYRQVLERIRAAQERDEANGPNPDSIARLAEKILRSPNPRLRYTACWASQRIVVPCKRFLPQRVFEWLFCLIVGV